MASRPVFVVQAEGPRLVAEVLVDFEWFPGFAPSQKRKSIAALHRAAAERGVGDILEVSSKSDDEAGRRLSAFSLTTVVGGREVFLESAYQASKAFRAGGPYVDLLDLSPRDAKRDPRLRASGELVAFEMEGTTYPLEPKNAFYDWLYLRAIYPDRDWIGKCVTQRAFTDIEFNPRKQANCQARALAEFVALDLRGVLDEAVADFGAIVGWL